MADAGNATLTYHGDSVQSIKVRANAYGWAFTVIAPESHAREHRAMYPHQRGLGPFMLQGQFLNYREYRDYMDFLRAYAKSWLHPSSSKPFATPGITVSLVREPYSEIRVGVPINGITDGDHVGNIGYTSPVIFQTIVDPLDPTSYTGLNILDNVSKFVLGEAQAKDTKSDDSKNLGDDTAKFFYPASSGSENSSIQATDIYGLGSAAGPIPTPVDQAAAGRAQINDAFAQITHTGKYGPFGSVTGLPGN